VIGKNDGRIIFNTFKHPSIVFFLHTAPFTSGFVKQGCLPFGTQSGKSKSGRFLPLLSAKATPMSIKNYSDIKQMDNTTIVMGAFYAN
jgi:hypothetical protein